MHDNNPLIKSDETRRIINITTATIYQLLKQDEKYEERPVMTDLSKIKNSRELLSALAKTAAAGSETQLGSRLAKQNVNAQAIDQSYDQSYEKLIRKMGVFKQPPAAESTAENENTPTPKKPGFKV